VLLSQLPVENVRVGLAVEAVNTIVGGNCECISSLKTTVRVKSMPEVASVSEMRTTLGVSERTDGFSVSMEITSTITKSVFLLLVSSLLPTPPEIPKSIVFIVMLLSINTTVETNRSLVSHVAEGMKIELCASSPAVGK